MQENLTPELIEYINLCKTRPHSSSYLIAILHKIQNKYGYLSQEHMEEVAHCLQIPTSTISGVATFYHFFRLKPKGKFSISICLGTACFVKGADKVLAAFQKELGIEVGEVTKDGLYSIDISRCVGVCAMAPVVMVNDKIYSNVQEADVLQILGQTKL